MGADRTDGPAAGDRCALAFTKLFEGSLCEITFQCGDLALYGTATDPHWIHCTVSRHGRVLEAVGEETGDGDGKLNVDGEAGTVRLDDEGAVLEFSIPKVRP